MPFVAVPPPRQTTGAREQKKRAQETSYSGKGRALALREGERKVEVMGLRQRREEKGCAPRRAQQVWWCLHRAGVLKMECDGIHPFSLRFPGFVSGSETLSLCLSLPSEVLLLLHWV